MQRNKSVLVLAAYAVAIAGCELIVHFDDSRLDAGTDVPTGNDVATDHTVVNDGGMDGAADADAQPMADVQPMGDADASEGSDVQPMTDVQPMVDTGSDAVDVPAMPDVQPDIVTVDASDSATPADVATDTGSFLMVENNCDPLTATDLTADATPTITFPGVGLTYSPPCVRIHPGQTITFAPATGVTFADHPLQGGTVSGATATPDSVSANPIGNHATETAPVVVTFPTAGSYGFYCTFHFSLGMEGAVYVSP